MGRSLVFRFITFRYYNNYSGFSRAGGSHSRNLLAGDRGRLVFIGGSRGGGIETSLCGEKVLPCGGKGKLERVKSSLVGATKSERTKSSHVGAQKVLPSGRQEKSEPKKG